MPSSTTKQARVMSAIAHGWRPSKGSVAKIPVGVAKEFHAADAGHKYGTHHSVIGRIHALLNRICDRLIHARRREVIWRKHPRQSPAARAAI